MKDEWELGKENRVLGRGFGVRSSLGCVGIIGRLLCSRGDNRRRG